ncbi:MAG: transposase, partial [Methylocella sp.]
VGGPAVYAYADNARCLEPFDVTGGEAHEVKGYDALMRLHEADPSKLLSDKGDDSDDIRRDLIDRGIEPVIPPRSTRKTSIQL